MAERGKESGIVGSERINIFRHCLEGSDEWRGIPVGDLQRDSEQHGEDKENRHSRSLEQSEGIKTERFSQRWPFARSILHERTGGEEETVDSETQSDDGA